MLSSHSDDSDRDRQVDMDDESSLSVHSYRLRGRGNKKKGKDSYRKLLLIALAIAITGVTFTVLWIAAGTASKDKWEKTVQEERVQKAELEKLVHKDEERMKRLEAENKKLKGMVDQLKAQSANTPTPTPSIPNTKPAAQTSKAISDQIVSTPPTPLPPLMPSQLPAPSPQPQSQTATVSKGAKGAPANVQNPNVVIDVPYADAQYLPLPINFLRKDSNGKGLAETLYPAADVRSKREEFQKHRIAFIDSKSNFPQVYLTKYNNALDEAFQKEGVQANEREWDRLNAKFGMDKLTTELPMCIMVPGYNNNANFRIEYNLNSIFSQNYTNYRLVLINDMSNDGSNEVYRNYFAFHKIDKQRYTYIENSKRVTALHNIYVASMNHCPFDSVVVTIDADDEFIGRNVLKVFNWGYQTKKSGVLYTNFMWYQQGSTLMYGFTSEYTEHEKKNNLFRSTPMKFSHLRSYRNELIFQIDPKDLQQDNGVFFTITYDVALFTPLMELSCGRVNKVDGEFHYLYNTGTGLNDYNDRGRQVAVENKIRQRKKYECYKDFDQRMNQ